MYSRLAGRQPSLTYSIMYLCGWRGFKMLIVHARAYTHAHTHTHKHTHTQEACVVVAISNAVRGIKASVLSCVRLSPILCRAPSFTPLPPLLTFPGVLQPFWCRMKDREGWGDGDPGDWGSLQEGHSHGETLLHGQKGRWCCWHSANTAAAAV
jgi:hypothetical protein